MGDLPQLAGVIAQCDHVFFHSTESTCLQAVSLGLSSLTLDSTGDGGRPNQMGGKGPLWSTYGSDAVAEQWHIRGEDHWWRIVVGGRGAEQVDFAQVSPGTWSCHTMLE